MIGLALPLGFLAEVDGFLKYLKPLELITVYAWAWILFGLVALIIQLATTLAVIAGASLVKQPKSAWANSANAWLAMCIAAFALLQVSQLWLKANSLTVGYWMERFEVELILVTAMSCGIWIWRRREFPETVRSIAVIGLCAGLAVVALAPVLQLLSSSSSRNLESKGTALNTSERRLPNIVVLTIDSLAAEHMSLYGYMRQTTPNLDLLARQASVFDHFYSNANFTTSSLNSILLGQRPWSHRVIHSQAMLDVASADRSLVAILHGAGYQTVAAGTQGGPLILGIRRWLDRYGEIPVNSILLGPVKAALPYHARLSFGIGLLGQGVRISHSIRMRFHAWRALLIGGSSETGASEAIGGSSAIQSSDAGLFSPAPIFAAVRGILMQRDLNKPFFLWVHLLPPHSPYAAPAPFLGRFDAGAHGRTRFDSTPREQFLAATDPDFPDRYIGRYDESILYADYHVGQFLEWLMATGLFDDSMIIVTADHGESFTKGYSEHCGPMLHEPVIRIPLIIKAPGQKAGARIAAVGEQVDLAPTIFDSLGIKTNQLVEGRSLWPAISGDNLVKPVFSMNLEQSGRYGALDTGTVAMIEGRWKYVHYFGHLNYPMMPKLKDALYDLENDPDEDVNLIATRQDVANGMLRTIQSQLQTHGAPIN